MSTDAKKHTSIASGEQPSRAAILSINDVVPVANATEQAQVASAVVAGGQVLASAPLLTRRADAPGLHTVELTKDGTVFVPVSGQLRFASDSARDSWTTANSALLAVYDECVSNGLRYLWDGAAWAPQDWIAWTPTVSNVTGTTTAMWRMNGLHEVECRVRIAVTTMGTNPTVTLPKNASDALVEHLNGTTACIPSAGSEVPGITRKAAVGSVTFFYLFVSGSTVYSNNIGASAPFAWASGTLHANFSYQV